MVLYGVFMGACPGNMGGIQPWFHGYSRNASEVLKWVFSKKIPIQPFNINIFHLRLP